MSNPAPHVEVGAEVRYVAHACHALDRDHARHPLFEFVHDHDAPNSAHGYRKGDVVKNHGDLGLWQKRDETGAVHTAGGHRIRPTKPLRAWKAVVREVFADGSVALDVEHPHGGITLHCPEHGLKPGDAHGGGTVQGVPYDPTGAVPHSWHLPLDEKGA